METITMKELIVNTGAMRETIRCQIRSKKIECLGLIGGGRNKTSLYRKSDVQFILDTNFSNYKKERRSIKVAELEHPFSNKLATSVIRTGFIKLGVN